MAPQSPYARSKVVVEDMLRDFADATPLRVISLRFFDPIGTDPQFRTGLQDPQPTHALGKLVQLTQQGEPFAITGTDYATRDSSGIRDYVHVWDLAAAHLAALDQFEAVLGGATYSVVNLGTGRGTTVKELIAAFESVLGRFIEVTSAPRRPGDSAGAFTRSDMAERVLGWTPQLSLEQGIADTRAWFRKRPELLGDLDTDRRPS